MTDPQSNATTSQQAATGAAELPTPPGRPCKKCATPLALVMNGETGKTAPLDTRAPVYALVRQPGGFAAVPAKRWLWNAVRMDPENAKGQLDSVIAFYVSHFATCKFADEFNKGKQQAAKDAKSAEWKVSELAGTFIDYLEATGGIDADGRVYVEALRDAIDKAKAAT